MQQASSLGYLLAIATALTACDRQDEVALNGDRASAHMNGPSVRDAKASALGTARADAKFKAAQGYDLAGTVDFAEANQGVKISVSVNHAPPGKKGIHIHEKPDCSDIPGKSMGDHFAPTTKTHALPDVSARHLGDLGNIEIGADGNGHLEILVPHANLKVDDPLSYLKRAVVIHESHDKGTQPSGDAGKPIACAIVEKASG